MVKNVAIVAIVIDRWRNCKFAFSSKCAISNKWLGQVGNRRGTIERRDKQTGRWKEMAATSVFIEPIGRVRVRPANIIV